MEERNVSTLQPGRADELSEQECTEVLKTRRMDERKKKRKKRRKRRKKRRKRKKRKKEVGKMQESTPKQPWHPMQ